MNKVQYGAKASLRSMFGWTNWSVAVEQLLVRVRMYLDRVDQNMALALEDAGFDWHAAAERVTWRIQPFIGGAYRPSRSVESFDNINPATDKVLCRVAVGHPSDIDEAVQTARRRFTDGCWSDLPPIRRAQVLARLADLMVERSAELALLDSLEMGKPITASNAEVSGHAAGLLRSCADFADKLLGASAPITGGALHFNTFEPRGVVGAISPWNFPTLNAIYKLAPALAAGNTLILKPSELSSASALKIAELAIEAGVPEGVLNVVPGLGATVGSALALHPDVDILSFTGSTATGRKIMEMSGLSNGKPLLLECGGKSPHVVFADVDNLDAVAEMVVQWLLKNSGQVCSAHTRLVVQQQVKDALLDKVISRMSQFVLGDPLDQQTTFGPLASAAQKERVDGYIKLGLEEGAAAVFRGGSLPKIGCYVPPVVFDSVDQSMAIVREEIFGPVLCVQSFTTESEAVALANGTDYGLAATVWTRDLGRAKRMARAIRAGYLTIRTSGEEGMESGCVISREPQKASGFGSEVGLRGLQAYSTLKSVLVVGA